MKRGLQLLILFSVVFFVIGCTAEPESDANSQGNQDSDDNQPEEVEEGNQPEETEKEQLQEKEDLETTTNENKEPETEEVKQKDEGVEETADMSTCETDLECVPEPVCHPMNCVNEKYLAELGPAPEICTAMFSEQAAYDKEDCSCVEGVCVNMNNQ